ncbi:MAG TPA: T9SS sorting signal type C domain-containing protein [Moheibacter sp.]|nr:T9SS sorting signal type C domain-containing protein [Moheibacter sp.]
MKYRFLLIFLLASVCGWGQVTILNWDFTNNNNAVINLPGGTTTISSNGITAGTNGCNGKGYSASGWNSGDYIQILAPTTGYSIGELTLNVRSSNTGPAKLDVQYSTTGVSGIFTTIGQLSSTNSSSCVSRIIDLSSIPELNNNPNVVIRLVGGNYGEADGNPSIGDPASGGTFRMDDIKITGELPSGPTLTTSATSLSDFTYTEDNGPSASQALTITGNNLEDDELVGLTVLDDYFEISETASGTYSDNLENIVLSPSSNEVTVYVRLKSGLPIGTYEDELGIESTIQDGIYISLSGNVTCTIPETPNGTITPGANPACGSTTLTYEHGTGQPEDEVIYYWQTSETGTDITHSASSTYTVNATGNYYVRAFNGNCWSDEALESAEIIINSTPTISTQPTDQTVTIGATAQFSVTATGSPSYQWYESTDGGTNWTTLTGATSNTYTTPATTLAMDGYQYRVTATNDCGEISSEDVTLNVTEGPVVKTYTLVTDVSQLEAGKKYLIANSATAGDGQALGLQNPNYRAQSAVTVVMGLPNTITTLPASTPSGTEPFELTLGGSTGAWTFQDVVNGGFLYPVSGKNYLRTATGGSNNYNWSISIAANGTATIATTVNNRTIKYNSNASIFSAYTSASGGVTLVHLYKEGGVVATDTYFRSKGDGAWTSNSTWESSEDGITWYDATSYPGASAESVEIRAGNTIEINNTNVKVKNTNVYGTLVVKDNDFELVGTGYALTIKENGTFAVDGNAKPTSGSTGQALVETGGTFQVISFSGSNNLVDNYLLVGNINNKFKFAHHSIFDWNTSNTLGSSGFDEIFDVLQPGDLVIFKITQTFSPSNYGSSTSNLFHAVLDLPGDRELSLQGNGNKIFEGGIKGEGILNIIYNSGSGKLVFGQDDSPLATLGDNGNLTLKTPHNKLELENIQVPADAYVTISSDGTSNPNTFERTAGNIEINGTLDITNMRITNTATGNISVNDRGTLRTRHTGGLFGSNSAIVEEANLVLNTGSTVEYYADENQSISSGKEYYHLVFSGSGTKTPQNQTDVNTDGSITIIGSPIVDYTNFNLGSTSGNSTDFTMDGGKLIIGTGGTQPRPGGSYAITDGAIEFTGDSNTDIKVSPNYHDIIISGKNKTPRGKGFKIDNILYVTAVGKLTIPSTQDSENPYVLTAREGVQVAPGGQLILENNANLMQNVGAVNSGNIKVMREATVPSNQYNFWSSPVEEQNLYEIYENIPANRVMTYNTWDDYYTIVPNPTTAAFGIGYSIKGPSSNSPDGTDGTNVTAIFTGAPHNQSTTMNSIPLATQGQGFNLIGNPFPSNLNIKELYDANSAVIEPSFLFWDNVGNTVYNQQGSGYSGINFAVYNAEFGDGTAATNETGSGKVPNGIVKPGQGFLVQAKEGVSSLHIDNSMRTNLIKLDDEDENAPYYKNGNPSQIEFMGARPREGKFWLELMTSKNLYIQIAVGYFEDADSDFDKFDTSVVNESASDNLYSYSSDSEKLTINGRSSFSKDDVVPLGVNLYEYGKYKIILGKTKGIFKTHQKIYLRDKYLNIIHNLSASDYEFEAPEGEFTDRFEVLYTLPSNVAELTTASRNQLKILQQNEEILISSSKDKILEVEVFNLAGWSVYQKSNLNANEWKIPSMLLGKQIIVVKVLTETGEVVTKKIINK